MSQRLYRGWIPNATARLSFTKAESNRKPDFRSVFTANRIFAASADLLVSERIDIREAGNDAFGAGFRATIRGRSLHIVLYGKRESALSHGLYVSQHNGGTSAGPFEKEQITGQMLIISQPRFRRGCCAKIGRWLGEAGAAVKEASRFDPHRQQSESLPSPATPSEKISSERWFSEFATSVAKLRNSCSHVDYILVDWRLKRSGEFTLALPEETVDIEKVARPLQLAVQVFPHAVAQCCYRHVVNIFHAHYHHRASDQAITRVYPLDDDRNWRVATLYDLVRAALTLRRSNSIEDRKRAEGIIGYAELFQAKIACGRYKKSFDGNMVRNELLADPYDFTWLRTSLDASTSVSEWRHGRFIQASVLFLTLFFTVTNTVIGIVRTRGTTMPDKSYELTSASAAVVSYVADHPMFLIVGVPLVITLLFCSFFNILLGVRPARRRFKTLLKSLRTLLAPLLGFNYSHTVASIVVVSIPILALMVIVLLLRTFSLV